MEEQEAIIVFDMLSYLFTQKTTAKKVKKSLWIILYSKLRYKLNYTATEAEEITYELMLNLFDYSLKKIDSKIYVTSIVNGMPVFGAKRKSHYTNDKLEFIAKLFEKEVNTSNINSQNIYKTLKSNIDKPNITYLFLYPQELLELNSKSSE